MRVKILSIYEISCPYCIVSFRLDFMSRYFFFINRSASSMFKDVQATLLEIIQKEGQCPFAEAQKTLVDWMETYHFIKEVWS